MESVQSEKAYWEGRYSGGGLSGDGSYGETLKKKLDVLAKLPDVKKIVEIGCGDFNFGKNLLFTYKLPFDSYVGYDLSEYIVERNKKFYPTTTFKVMPDEFPTDSGDLLLAVDVLYHQSDESYLQLVENLKKLWTNFKYLALTAYDREPNAGENQGHIHIRKFDPSPFGEPLYKEAVENDDLKLYVFEH